MRGFFPQHSTSDLRVRSTILRALARKIVSILRDKPAESTRNGVNWGFKCNLPIVSRSPRGPPDRVQPLTSFLRNSFTGLLSVQLLFGLTISRNLSIPTTVRRSGNLQAFSEGRRKRDEPQFILFGSSSNDGARLAKLVLLSHHVRREYSRIPHPRTWHLFR